MNRLEELESAYRIKQHELNEIIKLRDEESGKQYSHFVGKYFELSATCFIYINKIGYVIEDCVYISGIRIYGDRKNRTNGFTLDMYGDESFFINSQPKEVTKEQFLTFMNECYNKQVETVMEELK